MMTKVLRGALARLPDSRVREAAPRQPDFGARSSSIRRAFKRPGAKSPLPTGLRASIITRVSFEGRKWTLDPLQTPASPTQAQRPKNVREADAQKGGGAPAAARSLTEGQQDAAEAQHPQNPHGEWPASPKSFSVAGAASTLQPRV